MAFDVEAARAEGYTEEEIQAYLRSETNTPVPVQEQPGRGAEIAATAGAVTIPPVVAGVGTGLGAYGAYQSAKYLAPKIAEAYQNFRGNPSMPTPGSSGAPIGATPSAAVQRIPISTGPVAPPGMSAPPPAPATMPSGRPYSPQAQEFMSQRTPPAPQISNAQSIVQRLALDRLLKGGVGAAALLTPSTTNANEQEELRRRQAMPPYISR